MHHGHKELLVEWLFLLVSKNKYLCVLAPRTAAVEYSYCNPSIERQLEQIAKLHFRYQENFKIHEDNSNKWSRAEAGAYVLSNKPYTLAPQLKC